MSELIDLSVEELNKAMQLEKSRHESRKEEISQARYFVMAKGNAAQREAAGDRAAHSETATSNKTLQSDLLAFLKEAFAEKLLDPEKLTLKDGFIPLHVDYGWSIEVETKDDDLRVEIMTVARAFVNYWMRNNSL